MGRDGGGGVPLDVCEEAACQGLFTTGNGAFCVIGRIYCHATELERRLHRGRLVADERRSSKILTTLLYPQLIPPTKKNPKKTRVLCAQITSRQSH